MQNVLLYDAQECTSMGLDERLRAIAEALPEEGRVSFTRSDLLDMIAAELAPKQLDRVAVDLTVAEVAELLRRAPGTVRGWCAAGELPGAYRMHGREWRVPMRAVEFLQRRAAERHLVGRDTPVRREAVEADLGAWRRAG